MAETQRTATSTQIRNMYSDGMSYMNIKFFNTNLAFSLYPFTSKDATGKSTYDLKAGQQTTVNYEGAYALYQTAKDIIDGKIQETNLPIPCAAGATLILERKLSPNGSMETVFSITKNNMTIPFRFQTITQQAKVDGQLITKVIESGLGAFMKTIEGYLNGINSDRHLDKLTEDYVKSQEGQSTNKQQNGYNNYNNGNYNRNNNYGNGKKPYNNNYRRPYNGNNGGNNGYGNNNNNGYNSQPNQQNFSSYNVHD